MKFERLKHQFSRFKKDEDGAIMAYIIVTFLLMVVATGMAIDLMRHEIARADVQNALDRAVLAAASQSQRAERELVFNSYMDTRSFHELNSVTIDHFDANVTSAQSFVTAQAHYDVPTWFMKLIGITELTAPAASSALQGLSEIEIVLVFDHSGSMDDPADRTCRTNCPSRLDALKTAATDFVTTTLGEGGDTYTQISIVPFQTTSAIQPMMAAQYSGGHACHHFRPSDFTRADIPTDLYLPEETNKEEDACDTSKGRAVIPFTNDETFLKEYIGDMFANGYTSQNHGMKWAVAMLDPSFRKVMRGIVTDMKNGSPTPGNGADYELTPHSQIMGLPITKNDAGNAIVDLARANSTPLEYGEDGVQKIIVLMTDGHNRAHPKKGYGSDANLHDHDKYTQQLNAHLKNVCDVVRGRDGEAALPITVYTIAFNLSREETEQWEGWFGDPNDRNFPAYDKAMELLQDNPTTGCASAGKHYNVKGASELAGAFSSIAAEVTRLKLVN